MDYKYLIANSMLITAKSLNEGDLEPITVSNEVKVVFITNFGYIKAEKVIELGFKPEQFSNENIFAYLVDTTIKRVNEISNEKDISKESSCINLQGVEITTFKGEINRLSNMILFSDQIVGITFGDQTTD